MNWPTRAERQSPPEVSGVNYFFEPCCRTRGGSAEHLASKLQSDVGSGVVPDEGRLKSEQGGVVSGYSGGTAGRLSLGPANPTKEIRSPS